MNHFNGVLANLDSPMTFNDYLTATLNLLALLYTHKAQMWVTWRLFLITLKLDNKLYSYKYS